MNNRQLRKAVKAANTIICGLDNYHRLIPLQTMFDALSDDGLVALQEDDTEWAGVLCGDEGEARIQIGTLDSAKFVEDCGCTMYPQHVNHLLCVSWYKMPSGRYEVNAYVS